MIIDKAHDHENKMHSWPDNHFDIIIIVTIHGPHGHVSIHNIHCHNNLTYEHC